jgi:hypothetical protein
MYAARHSLDGDAGDRSWERVAGGSLGQRCRPTVCGSLRWGDVTAPHDERESRCVPWPRVALGWLGRPRLRRINRSG